VVIFAAVVLWWVWCRVYQRQPGRLLRELPILAAAMLAPLAWIVRNTLLVDQSLAGTHLDTGGPVHTFQQGAARVIGHTSQLFVPALRDVYEFVFLDVDMGLSLPLIPYLHLLIGLPVLVLLIAHSRRSRAAEPAPPARFAPHRSPLLLAAAAYIGVYTIIQPFVGFLPMDARDATTMLCLLQPWLLVMVVQALKQRAPAVMSLYVLANLLILIIPVGWYGMPGVLRFSPTQGLQVVDLSDQPAKVLFYRQHFIPEWLLVIPHRTTTLQRHHPELMAYLRDLDTDVVVESNYSQILFYTNMDRRAPVRSVGERFYVFNFREYQDWLKYGECHFAGADGIVVLFNWDVYRATFAADVAALQAKCPELSPVQTESGPLPMQHSVVYHLEQAPPGSDQ
jgi:hypothetical protein